MKYYYFFTKNIHHFRILGLFEICNAKNKKIFVIHLLRIFLLTPIKVPPVIKPMQKSIMSFFIEDEFDFLELLLLVLIRSSSSEYSD
jgi:hypothetical protein